MLDTVILESTCRGNIHNDQLLTYTWMQEPDRHSSMKAAKIINSVINEHKNN